MGLLFLMAVGLIAAVASFSCSGGKPSAGPAGEPTAEPTAVATQGVSGELRLGASSQLGSQQITTGGGTLTVSKPGDPLDGLEVTVPQDAYDAARTFTVSSQPITISTYDDRITPASPLISIDNGGGYASDVMTVKVPVKLAPDQFAMGFFYDPDTGTLEGMPLVSEDGLSVTVATRHFSDFFISTISQALLQNLTIDTGFKPGVDDWQFVNYGSFIEPGGQCAGMSVSAIWYFYERANLGKSGDHLYGRYDNYRSSEAATPDLWEDDNLAYRLTAVIQRDHLFGTLESRPFFVLEGTNDTLQMLAFAYALHVTHAPQLVGLTESSTGAGHAVVGYKIEARSLWVADPNFPGLKSAANKIEYANGAFVPYRSALAADSDPTTFDKIGYYAVSALLNWDKIGARFAEMEAGAVGGEYFPAYTVSGASPNSQQLVPLTDGVIFPGPAFLESITGPIRAVAPAVAVGVYRDETQLTKGVNGWPLQPGENNIGITVLGVPGASSKYEYVDFYRVKVIYNEVVIAPDPITGDAGDDLSITATMPAEVKDARFEWNFGDGSPTENLTLRANHVFAKAGNYTVSIKVYDNGSGRLIGQDEAVAKIGQGATPATATPGGAGQWVLRLTKPDADKNEGAQTSGGPGVVCDVITTVSSSETSAQTATAGSCDDPDYPDPANEVTQHSWTAPPARLTPGQEVTGTMSVSHSGYCWVSRGETALQRCQQAARTDLGVETGSGTAATGEFTKSGLVYDREDIAMASKTPSVSFKWTVPTGSLATNVLKVRFIASVASGYVYTYFFYEWQGP